MIDERNKIQNAPRASSAWMKFTWLGRIFCLIILAGAGTQVRGSTATLAWEASPDTNVVGYVVYYGPAGSAAPTHLVVQNTNVTLNDFQTGITYAIHVTAFNAINEESDPSNTINFTPTVSSPTNTVATVGGDTNTVPTTSGPTNQPASQQNGGAASSQVVSNSTPFSLVAVQLAWDPSLDTNVVGYVVYYGPAGTNASTRRSVLDTNVTITDLQAEVTYTIYVTAFNANNEESEPSNLLTFTAHASAPTNTVATSDFVSGGTNTVPTTSGTTNQTASQQNGDPAGSQVVSNSTSLRLVGIQLAWDASLDTNVSGYILYLTTSNNVAPTRVVVGNTTTATVSNLVEGVTYQFYATAYNEVNEESDPSNLLTFTPTAANVAAPAIAKVTTQPTVSTAPTATASATPAAASSSEVTPAPRILSINLSSAGAATVSWSSVTGKTYRLMTRVTLSATDWTNASPAIVATDSTTSFTHTSTGTTGFYAVAAE